MTGLDVALLAVLAALSATALGVRRFRDRLASMRLAITLLAVVAGLSILGVLIGQGLPADTYTEQYGPGLGAFIARSGLASIFRAWYFLFTVWVLALSIVACAVSRLARLVRSRGRKLSRIGSLVSHLAIVVILAGGVASAITGRREAAPRFLGAGETIEVPGGGYSLRVDRAETEFNATGLLSDYVSLVTVIEDGRESGPYRIEVNHPLEHRGIGVYQFQMLPAAQSIERALIGVAVPSGGESRVIDVVAPFQEAADVPGTELSVKVLAFLSDFTYDIDSGTAELASVWHDNPAVLVQVTEAGRVSDERWVFLGTEGHRNDDTPYRLFLLDYAPDYAHGLTRFEFSRQPGTPLLYAGLSALSLGLCLTLWTRRSGRSGEDEQ
jgi:hypothetical protein